MELSDPELFEESLFGDSPSSSDEDFDGRLNAGALKGVKNLTQERDKASNALRKHQAETEKAREFRDKANQKLSAAARSRFIEESLIGEAERSAQEARLAPRAAALPGQGRLQPGSLVRFKPHHPLGSSCSGIWRVEGVVNYPPQYRLSQNGGQVTVPQSAIERPLTPNDRVKVARWTPQVYMTLPFVPAAHVEGTLLSQSHGSWLVQFTQGVFELPDNVLINLTLEAPAPPPPGDDSDSLIGGFHALDKVRDLSGTPGVVLGVCPDDPDLLEVAMSSDFQGRFEKLFTPCSLVTEEAYWQKQVARSNLAVSKWKEDERRHRQDLEQFTARHQELEAASEALSKAFVAASKALTRASKHVVDIRLVTTVSFKSLKGRDQRPQSWRDVSKYVDTHWALALSRPAEVEAPCDGEGEEPPPPPVTRAPQRMLLSLADAKGFAKSVVSHRDDRSSAQVISVTGKRLEDLRKGRNKAVSFAVRRKLAKDIVKMLKPGAKLPPELHSLALLKAALGAEEGVILSKEVQDFFDSPEIGIIRAKEVPPPDCLANVLRPYQLTGYHWLVNNARNGLGCILADDMGLGKTLQAISLMMYLKSNGLLTKPMLVIVPKGLLGTWQRELKKWAGDSLKVNLYFGHQRKAIAGMGCQAERKRPKAAEPPAPKRRKLTHKQPAPSCYLPVPEKKTKPPKREEEHAEADVFLTSYGVFRTDAARFLRKDIFGGMILDEAQQIKNYNTQTSQEVKRVAELVGPIRVSLSGTPVENKMSDLHSQFEFILPGYLAASRADFQRTFERPLQIASKRRAAVDPVADAAREKLRQITSPFVLRRRKTDPNIVPDLPDKVEMSHEVELSAIQRRLYKAVQEAYERDRGQMDREARGDKLRRGAHIFRMLQGLREICNHPGCLDEKRRPADVAGKDYPELENIKASGKSEKLHELLEEQVFANDEKALIFSSSLSAIEMLAQQIKKRFNCEPLKIIGEMSVEQREATVKRFQEDRLCTVLLLGVQVGGLGLTLTAATHVVHYDRCYNPAKEMQCTDRAHRIGQHKTVTVHTLTSQDSFEARLDEIMQRKKHLSDFTSQSCEQWIAEYNDDEIRELFRLGTARD